MARETQTPPPRVSVGDRFPEMQLTPITGETVPIPDASGAFFHLQFRRFAGCPICNLHLRSVSARIDEITAAGIVKSSSSIPPQPSCANIRTTCPSP
jgi:peroxiredoxin